MYHGKKTYVYKTAALLTYETNIANSLTILSYPVIITAVIYEGSGRARVPAATLLIIENDIAH